MDLRAEVEYVHSTLQGMSDLIGGLFPRETKDTEERAALRGRVSKHSWWEGAWSWTRRPGRWTAVFISQSEFGMTALHLFP